MAGAEEARDFCRIMKRAEDLLKKEPPCIELPDDRPMVFIGDLHGDHDIVVRVEQEFQDHRRVYLGDYGDNSLILGNSVKTVREVINAKACHPQQVHLLRGNHEFEGTYSDENTAVRESLMRDVKQTFPLNAQEILKQLGLTFCQLPYIAMTYNGVVALHGGLPMIRSLNDLESIPKGLAECLENLTVCQTVWNDNVADSRMALGNGDGWEVNTDRDFNTPIALKYGEPFFSKMMDKLGKRVLVRGHDERAKGYALDDRILTIFSSRRYNGDGNIKGTYVAVMDDPTKPIDTARDLRLVFFN